MLMRAERFIISNMDRRHLPEFQMELQGEITKAICSVRREKWHCTFMQRSFVGLGTSEWVLRLQRLADEIAQVTMDELLPVRAALLNYLASRKLTGELIAELHALAGHDEQSVARWLARDSMEQHSAFLRAEPRGGS